MQYMMAECRVRARHCAVPVCAGAVSLFNLNQKKKMKYLSLAVIALLLAGCASAPSQGYRPANYPGAPWSISGDMNHFTNSVVIKINDQTVIDKSLSIFGGDGEFSGTYDGKAVSASCFTSRGFFGNKTDCIVFVNSEKAATLTF